MTPPTTWVRCKPVMAKKVAPNIGEPQGFWNRRTPSWIKPNHSRMWRRAKRIPPATVRNVQRNAPDLSPVLAARVAIHMVRLLLPRTQVISITLRMLGANLKGSGQLGLAFLRYP